MKPTLKMWFLTKYASISKETKARLHFKLYLNLQLKLHVYSTAANLRLRSGWLGDA